MEHEMNVITKHTMVKKYKVRSETHTHLSFLAANTNAANIKCARILEKSCYSVEDRWYTFKWIDLLSSW